MSIAELSYTICREQADGCSICPRCGRSMKPRLHTNAMSRQLPGVYVCDSCGPDEALRDFARCPLPPEEWSAAQAKNKSPAERRGK